MKGTIFFIYFFCFHNCFSQFNNNDSLITNPVEFKNYMFIIKNIDASIAKIDSITHDLNNNFKWKFICSYKKGWQTVIGFNSPSSSVKMHRTDFDNICILRSGNHIFTTSELKKLFYLGDSKFIKDSIGNIIKGPMIMTKNNKNLIITQGSSYPNGNQTSWYYSLIYYFTREVD